MRPTCIDWTPRWPLCLVFGHEREGVTASVAAQIEAQVRIPMFGGKRSLNVATAGGVVLYELLRRHRYAAWQPADSARGRARRQGDPR